MISIYLLYAIGEILLVVIGILIALQINTWNADYIDAQKGKAYLRNLIEDLKTQENPVNIQIQHEAKMRRNCEKVLKQLNVNTTNGDFRSNLLLAASYILMISKRQGLKFTCIWA